MKRTHFQISTAGLLAMAVCLFLWMIPGAAIGQLISGEAFMQGTYLEVGVAACGTFGTQNTAPAGYHANAAGGALGFVADVGQDGWTIPASLPYCGDYFLPGSPEEGFGVEQNGITQGNFGRCGEFNIPGSVTSYTNSGGNHTTVWQGNDRGIEIINTTKFPETARYFVTEVNMTNTTGATINNVYYFRNVDPDNEQPWTGSFQTDNTVVSNGGGTSLVTAVGQTGACYLGLGAKDSRARVSWGGFFVRDGSDVWDGTGGLTGAGTTSCDCAISISFNLGNLAPGESVCFSYAYILDASQLDLALDATSSPVFFANGTDISSAGTINVCAGQAVDFEIVGGAGFDWSWSPASFLSSTTGASVTATPTSTITYTVTGTNACETIVKNLTVIVNADVTGPSITCPPDVVLSTCGDPVPNLVPGATATDDCTSGADITITQAPSAGAPAPATVTLTASDLAGNSSSCTVEVTGGASDLVVVASSNGPVCEGETIDLDVSCDVGSARFIRAAGVGASLGVRSFDGVFLHGDLPGTIDRIGVGFF